VTEAAFPITAAQGMATRECCFPPAALRLR
jgi:hypothetical protein